MRPATPSRETRFAAHGYTQSEPARGWTLLHAASGYQREPDFGTEVDPTVLAAVSELDSWDQDGFRIVHAALSRLHPDQARTVLDGIGPSTGVGAVVGVKLLLDRVDTLAKSTDPGDQAAMKTLAARGITGAERKRLRALVEIAEKGTSEPAPPPGAKERAARAAEHHQALVDLRVWYEDWSGTARAVIKRRDRLIRIAVGASGTFRSFRRARRSGFLTGKWPARPRRCGPGPQ